LCSTGKAEAVVIKKQSAAANNIITVVVDVVVIMAGVKQPNQKMTMCEFFSLIQ
jgi:hypothetical protein